jgi:hypothetical protein
VAKFSVFRMVLRAVTKKKKKIEKPSDFINYNFNFNFTYI